jgi:hypothetical protein
MSENIRRTENRAAKLDSGIYMARIVGHLDPSYMGSLEVTLLRSDGNDINDATQTYVVKYANPFYGVTGYDFQGNNTQAKNGTQAGFDDTQKSYGMSFVPPDVGTTVLAMFVEGNPAEGYWIGCVMDRFANHMIPAIGSSDKIDISPEDKTKYDYKSNQFLPVAEINRLVNDNSTGADISKIKKAVHPIADRFLEQGLLEDDIRGTSNSTMRRDIPAMVFGISTPGPKDRREGSKRVSIGKKQSKSTNSVPISRLGGTTFVMDDGDDQYQRKKPANEAGPDYADLLAGQKGTPNIPYGEHFRIRTRTGHQILFHNSEDLIYIGNARGTTWIELTSNGKIDVYAKDSISLHTENDLNIRADRDINLEAGRNVNMKAVSGRVRAEASLNFEVLAGADGKITVGSNFELVAGSNTKITSSSNFDLNSGGANKLTAAGATDIKSGGSHTESAEQIQMNGPPAASAVKAIAITPLSVHQNPLTSVESGWKKRYQSGTIDSIMKRVPMHEPWILHENLAPKLLTPNNTDRDT